MPGMILIMSLHGLIFNSMEINGPRLFLPSASLINRLLVMFVQYISGYYLTNYFPSNLFSLKLITHYNYQTTAQYISWLHPLTTPGNTLICLLALVEQMYSVLKKHLACSNVREPARTRNYTSSTLKMGGCSDVWCEHTQ